MSDRAVIVGVGARSAVGLRADSTAAALRAGVTRLAGHPTMVDRAGAPYNVAMDRTVEGLRRTDRIVALATSAIDEAAGRWLEPKIPLQVYLALPELGPFFTKADELSVVQRVSTHLASQCKPTIFPVSQGHAAGAVAVARASAFLQEARTALCVVVGSDSLVDPDILEALDESGRLMSVSNRWGYPPGEAAAALLLVDRGAARGMSVPILGSILGLGTAQEQALIATDDVCVGEGLAAAMRKALSSAPPEPVTRIYCDLNGERYRSAEYAYAVLRLHAQAFEDPTRFEATADRIGDVGAATVPMLATIAVIASRRGYARPGNCLVSTSSEQGLRGALVLEPGQAR